MPSLEERFSAVLGKQTVTIISLQAQLEDALRALADAKEVARVLKEKYESEAPQTQPINGAGNGARSPSSYPTG